MKSTTQTKAAYWRALVRGEISILVAIAKRQAAQ
jgi:hypothetical protein